MQLPLHSVQKNHDPLSITDQLCYRPHPEIEKKVKELVSEDVLTKLLKDIFTINWPWTTVLVSKVAIAKQTVKRKAASSSKP